MTIILVLLFNITFANWEIEKKKVDYLIDSVSKVDGVFIRNGTEHPAKKAAEHLQMKLDNALNSWFTPSKDKWTAVMFIEKVASKSSITGNPYLIKYKDGKTIEAETWLKEKLKTYPESLK